MIDKRRLKENLELFSFPRLSGTESERKSFLLAKNKIEDLNLNPTIQEFSYSSFYSRIYPKISLGLLSWLLFVLFLGIQPIFTIVNIILVFVFITFLIIITRKPDQIRIGKRYNSQNVFVKLPAQNENPIKNIFLFSHLDSKGQTFSIKVRVRLYDIWLDSFAISLLLILIINYFFDLHHLILRTVELIVVNINCISTLTLMVNKTNNKSKGAIDNASGITCVMELLCYFSILKNRPKNYNLWFVFTGAEESGTMGVRNFYKSIENYDKENSFIVNFDSISNSIILWDHGLLNNKCFKSFNYILENKDIMRLEKARRIYIGTYSDGLFLRNKKFKGLGNGDLSSYSYIHSVHDEIDKVNISVLEKLCNFYTVLLNEIDY